MYISIEKVRPCDVDPYGIMHHSIYLQMYENAIWGYLQEMFGIRDQYLMVKKADIKYVKPAYLGDILEVSTELKETASDGETLVFRQKIRKDKTVASKGTLLVELRRMKNGSV